MERVVRTLVLSDVVDSTQLVESLGEERAAELWTAHDSAARELLAIHRGREIDKTDGFLMLFESSSDAAAYAVDYHRALDRLAAERGLPLAARVGIHSGRVILRENPAGEVALGAKPLEVEGLAKPLAARVMSLARGRQTLLTGAARGQLRGSQPEGTQLVFHGHWRLKGVTDPVPLFEIGIGGAAPFAPPEDAEKAYRIVQVEERWQPVRDVPRSLPVELDAFVGREEDLAELARRLDGEARLVTVLGTGGTGKTRLVTRFAATWLGDYPGGAWFCDLAEARSVDGIALAVATSLGVPLGRDPVAQLGHAIAGRDRCLIILDNFEQVVEHAEATLGAWLARAPEASFLVTSRERLHLTGEELMPLDPLPIEGAGVELFVQRARAQRSEFAITEGNREAVEEVVRLLDGLPLAIELAAARLRVLSPSQLVTRLKDRFKLLVGARGAKERQATLRAAIDWSWDLLEPWEQAAFAQASVFEGGFTLDAAEDVLDLSAFPDAPLLLDVVQSLVDKSLLRTWTPTASGARHEIDETFFGMYVSIQEYAAERLRAEGGSGDGLGPEERLRAIHERHGAHYAAFGTEEALDGLGGTQGDSRSAALALELDNLVVASTRAVACGDGATAAPCLRAAWLVLHRRGPLSAGARLAEPILAIEGLAPADRERALLVKAASIIRTGLSAEAIECLELVVDSARSRDDERMECEALRALYIARSQLGEQDLAREALQAALVIHRRRGDRLQEGTALNGLASDYRERGLLAEARPLYEESLRILRELDPAGTLAHVLGNVGILNRLEGDLAGAREAYDAALALHREAGDRRQECLLLNNLGNLHRDLAEPVQAIERFGEALVLARAIGERFLEGSLEANLGTCLADNGEREEGRVHLERACAINAECGSPGFEADAWCGLGSLHAEEGRPEAAREAFDRAEALLRRIGDELYLGLTLCCRAMAETKAGEAAAADAAIEQAAQLAERLESGPDSLLGKTLERARAARDATA